MLTFGEQLYRLTERDEATILIDPFQRAVSAQMGVGVANLVTGPTGQIPNIPVDRSLWIHSIQILGGPEAATAYRELGIQLVRGDGSLHQLWLDNQVNGAAGAGVARYIPVGLALPPGSQSPAVNAVRVGTTGVATVTMWITGYLIPPGRIVRS